MPRRNSTQMDLLSYRPRPRKRRRKASQPRAKIRRIEAGNYEWYRPEDEAVIAAAAQGVMPHDMKAWVLTFYAYDDDKGWVPVGDSVTDTLREAKDLVEDWAKVLEEHNDSPSWAF
jgi:hypothetical protein